jgi:hypothetical protein
MKRPDYIPPNAWKVMQFLRYGNNLCIPIKGNPYAGCLDVPISAVDFLLSNNMLIKTSEYDWASFYRMTDEAWAIAAGDKK